MIDVKERFVPRKEKVYLLSREEKEEIREFIQEQLRKGYIQPSKSPQTVPVFFVGKKDGKSRWCKITGILMSGQLRTTICFY